MNQKHLKGPRSLAVQQRPGGLFHQGKALLIRTNKGIAFPARSATKGLR
jgi:hypothetical protein